MKRMISQLLALILCVMFAGCEKPGAPTKETAYQFVDSLGYTVKVSSVDHVILNPKISVHVELRETPEAAGMTTAKAKNSDTMTGAMLKDQGCRNIADRENSLLENLSMEVIIREDPDYIFMTTQGASAEAAEQVMAQGIQSCLGRAVRGEEQQILRLPRNLFHYKPNNRWGESYEILAEILYGQA